jgi:hypothetical protein
MKKHEGGKLTFKNKKDPLNGFKMTVDSWRPEGKSAHEKTAIIRDLTNALKWTRTRRSLTYPKKWRWYKHKAYYDNKKIEALREEIKELKRELRLKVRTTGWRGKVRDALDEARKKWKTRETNLLSAQKLRDNKINRLEQRVDNQAKELRAVKYDLKRALGREETLKNKLALARKEKSRPRYVTKTVKAEIPLEVRRFMRYQGKRLDERLVNMSEIAVKSTMWTRDNGLTNTQLSALMEINLKGSSQRVELTGVTNTVLKGLEDQGYLNSVYTNAIKYYFLTATGEQKCKDYMNFLSYGKIT